MAELSCEVLVDASPETIFPFIVDPAKHKLWMGTEVSLDPRVGGEFRMLARGVYQGSGEYLEIVPNEKVVFTFGWEEHDHPIPAGSTKVSITLTPQGDKTLVQITHTGLPEDAVHDHTDGWSFYLQRLGVVATGGDPGSELL